MRLGDSSAMGSNKQFILGRYIRDLKLVVEGHTCLGREKRAVDQRQRVQQGVSDCILAPIVITNHGAIIDLALLTVSYSAATSPFLLAFDDSICDVLHNPMIIGWESRKYL